MRGIGRRRGPAVLKQLEALHPQPSHSVHQKDVTDMSPARHLDPVAVVSALHDMHASPHQGLDQLSVRKLQSTPDDLAGTLPGETAQEVLLGFVQRFADGQMPARITPLISPASLLAFPEPKSGVQPIAIGSVPRRLVSHVLLREHTPTARDYLTPQQVCCGVTSGCKAIIYEVLDLVNATHR